MAKLSDVKVKSGYRPSSANRKRPTREDLKAQNRFDPLLETKILEELQEIFDATYDVKKRSHYPRAFRPSGFPYCNILDAVGKNNEPTEYAKEFYLEVGTAVHAVVQDFIARSPVALNKIFANWKCKDCGHVHLFTPMPLFCASCTTHFERLEYEEVVFARHRGYAGHIDLLVKSKRGWIICDWKTTSGRGAEYRDEADEKHHHQLQAYCLALSEVFADQLEGLPVLGYCLMFVPRDQSKNFSSGKSNWTQYVYAWNAELAAQTKERLFLGMVSFETVTHGEETGNWLPAALMRPCLDLADFAKPMGMRDGFYKGDLCPNIDICSLGAGPVVDLIVKKRKALKDAQDAFANQHKRNVENGVNDNPRT